MALPNSYDQKDLIRCSATFTDSGGTAVDPTTVIFKFKTPAAAITTYTYGVDSELVKDDTGLYHVDVDANASGTWYYRFESTGTGQAADEAQFEIYESEFD